MRLPAPFRFLLGRVPSLPTIRRIVVMGSGAEPEVQRMLDSLREVFPDAHVLLLCDPECGATGWNERIGLDRMAADRRGTLRAVRAQRADLGVILVNGHWAFWRQWAIGSVVGARAYMLFNRYGGGFFARPRALPDLWRALAGQGSAASPGIWGPLFAAAGRALGLFVLAGEAIRQTLPARRLRPAFLLAQPRGVRQLAEGRAPEPAGTPAPDFTGERFVPGVDPDLELEHVSRYRFAQPLVTGQRVLDAGSGEGYGAALLARVAQDVVGVDVSADAVAAATQRYRLSNLRYVQVPAAWPWPFPDGEFARIVSFEVIEHVADWRGYLAELSRLLAPDGLLLISTPNRPYYRDERGERNEFHVHEFDLDEFRAALAQHFRNVAIWSQNHARGVLIEPPEGAPVQVESALAPTGRELATAHYLVALCSRRELPPAEGLMFVDRRGNQLREREREIERLRDELARARAAYAHLEQEFDARTRWALQLDAELNRRT